MRHEIVSVDVPTSGNGTARAVQNLCEAAVVVLDDGADTFDIKIQGKFSGAGDLANDVWFDIGTTAASAIFPLVDTDTAPAAPLAYTHVRVVVTTVGTVRPTVLVAGRNSRTEV